MIFLLRRRRHLLTMHLFGDFRLRFFLCLCRSLSRTRLDLRQRLLLCLVCSCQHSHRRLRLLARHLRGGFRLFLRLRRLGSSGRLGSFVRLVCIGQQDAYEHDSPLIEIFDPLLIKHRSLTQEDGHVLSIHCPAENHAFFQLVNGILLQHPLALPCDSLQIAGEFIFISMQQPPGKSSKQRQKYHAPCTSSFVIKDTILMLPFVLRSRKSPSMVCTTGNASRRDSSI